MVSAMWATLVWARFQSAKQAVCKAPDDCQLNSEAQASSVKCIHGRSPNRRAGGWRNVSGGGDDDAEDW
jgi:hypothetical protein